MKKIVVFILLNCVIACGVNSKKIVGKYYTAKPDIISIVELRDNGKFIYTFERDSFCSGKIEGNYKIENKKIKFVNDYEYSEAYQQSLVFGFPLSRKLDLSRKVWFPETYFQHKVIRQSSVQISLITQKISVSFFKISNK